MHFNFVWRPAGRLRSAYHSRLVSPPRSNQRNKCSDAVQYRLSVRAAPRILRLSFFATEKINIKLSNGSVSPHKSASRALISITCYWIAWGRVRGAQFVESFSVPVDLWLRGVCFTFFDYYVVSPSSTGCATISDELTWVIRWTLNCWRSYSRLANTFKPHKCRDTGLRRHSRTMIKVRRANIN